MCNKTDNSCREEKLGCKGCFYNDANEYINAKRYLLSRFNTIYQDERIKKSVFILLHWIDYQDELIKNDLMFKVKIIEKLKKDIKSINEKLHSKEYINLYRTYRLKGMKTKCKELLEFLERDKNND